jgi:hypothetical protein
MAGAALPNSNRKGSVYSGKIRGRGGGVGPKLGARFCRTAARSAARLPGLRDTHRLPMLSILTAHHVAEKWREDEKPP